ncbi:MAG: flagellar basal body-associated FliL family protein [Paracoccaceae bacterium]
MAEAVANGAEVPRKGLKTPLLAGGALALALGAGGFWATTTGMIPGPSGKMAKDAAAPPIAFVPLEPLIVTLPASAHAAHLRFAAQLEVGNGEVEAVAALKPRVLDVLNSYLRAVDTADIEDPAALARLRAQMLRRVQLVVGDGRVRDLLITEFVLN